MERFRKLHAAILTAYSSCQCSREAAAKALGVLRVAVGAAWTARQITEAEYRESRGWILPGKDVPIVCLVAPPSECPDLHIELPGLPKTSGPPVLDPIMDVIAKLPDPMQVAVGAYNRVVDRALVAAGVNPAGIRDGLKIAAGVVLGVAGVGLVWRLTSRGR